PGLAMQDSEASDKAEARDSSDEAPESSSERSMAPNTNWTRGRASSEGPTGPSRIYIDAGLDGGTAWGAALRIGPSALLGLRLSSGLFIDLEGAYAASDNYFAQASTTFHTDWWTVAAGAGMS